MDLRLFARADRLAAAPYVTILASANTCNSGGPEAPLGFRHRGISTMLMLSIYLNSLFHKLLISSGRGSSQSYFFFFHIFCSAILALIVATVANPKGSKSREILERTESLL